MRRVRGSGRAPAPIRPAPLPPPPRRGLRWGIALALVGLGLLYVCRSVIPVLVASVVIAWLLDPVMRRLEGRGLSRSAGAAVIAAGGSLIALILALLVVPSVIAQIRELSVNIVPYVAKLQDQIGPLKAEIEARTGLTVPVDLRDLAEHAPEYLQRLSPDMRGTIQGFLGSVAGGGLGVILQLAQISLVFPFTWFLLVDWPHLLGWARDIIPPRWRGETLEIVGEIDGRVFAFVQGQILVCALLGVLYTVGLLIAGIDLAVTVGMSSGFLFLVPYLGTVVGALLSSVLALLKFGPDWHVVACLLTFVIAQAIEGTFLTPFLVGDRVGLHPMVVIVALMVGGEMLGLWGLLLAVPVTASLAVLGERLVRYYKGSEGYRGG